MGTNLNRPKMLWIKKFSRTKLSWTLLFVSAFGLLATALVFQHVMNLQPCIQCIYQRTAVIGIMIAGLLPILLNLQVVRLLGLAVWGTAATKGLLSAREHIDIIQNNNPFFSSCGIVPEFPSFLPLHEWIPSVFGATGSCNENSWQFLEMGMAEWMQIIFIAYLAVLVVVVLAQFKKESANPYM